MPIAPLPSFGEMADHEEKMTLRAELRACREMHTRELAGAQESRDRWHKAARRLSTAYRDWIQQDKQLVEINYRTLLKLPTPRALQQPARTCHVCHGRKVLRSATGHRDCWYCEGQGTVTEERRREVDERIARGMEVG